MPDELDDVELKHGMESMATMTWTFYAALQEEGFKPIEALTLTLTWLRAITESGKSE